MPKRYFAKYYQRELRKETPSMHRKSLLSFDDKDYDAFVSYKSSPRDERFVLQHLYPKLEEEFGFKLCLHFRDFPPGEPIANNIIQAVERSRRTILILSPSYVSSEWCRLEYQKAQHEMLKMRHKIIPVVLEDVRKMPEMDKALRTIIDTVTYVEWPGDCDKNINKSLGKSVSDRTEANIERFWKLLTCSMPKKRKQEFADGYHRSVSRTSDDLPLTAVGAAVMKNAISSMLPLPKQPSKSCFNSVVDSLSVMNDIRDSCSDANESYSVKSNGFSPPPSINLQTNGARDSPCGMLSTVTKINSGEVRFYSQFPSPEELTLFTGNSACSVSRQHIPCKQRPTATHPRIANNNIPISNLTQAVSSESRHHHAKERTAPFNSGIIRAVNEDANCNGHYNLDLPSFDRDSVKGKGSSRGYRSPNRLARHFNTTNIDGVSGASTDSGNASSGDGSSCKSIDSSAGEMIEDAPNKRGHHKPTGYRHRNGLSSDDHIVEIRSIENKVVVTQRPRTLVQNSNQYEPKSIN
ncbi:toll-like receptor 2 [Plakobranchus ocellatus]|uniref:Toll-like receptor 2 n=1 Tax=Plakobranchus ocellatus TaxID=259542 RepID=A0AAV3YLM8_9GAST|nr:toll-like receptor 2 [Plakobranchus ocellatus]